MYEPPRGIIRPARVRQALRSEVGPYLGLPYPRLNTLDVSPGEEGRRFRLPRRTPSWKFPASAMSVLRGPIATLRANKVEGKRGGLVGYRQPVARARAHIITRQLTGLSGSLRRRMRAL
jgi:hypothetical protein